MTYKDAGRYAAKHGPNLKPDEKAAAAIRAKVKDGTISCAQAGRIAQKLKIGMEEVGMTIDLMEIRISKCQLGLFGHSEAEKLVKPTKVILSDLEDAIRKALINNRLPCGASWKIAEKFGIPKMRVSSTCEALKIKIKPCQLGAF